MSVDSISQQTLSSFARHETFHPRAGWLKKGVDAVGASADAFLRAEAPAELGVGKNMVRAIRYWCGAYKLVTEAPNVDRPRIRDAYATEFGASLLDDAGWDPYLEDTGSLWLLHWMLLEPPCSAPAWFAAFNHFKMVDFSDADLVAHLEELRTYVDGWGDVAESSIRKDVACIVRMYAGSSSSAELLDDSLDCPFIELDLLKRVPGTQRSFTFNTAPKPSLPPEVLGFACLRYAAREDSSARSIGISRLAYGDGSPGLVFKISETQLLRDLTRLASASKEVEVVDVAGAAQLVFRSAPGELAWDVLTNYYASRAVAA